MEIILDILRFLVFPGGSIGSYGQPDTNYGYAVRKEDAELLNKLNEGWKKLKASPKFQELVTKWQLR